MANFKPRKGQDYPSVEPDHLLDEHDPLVVKVPMDHVEWGGRKSAIAKAKNPESGGNSRMTVKHADKK